MSFYSQQKRRQGIVKAYQKNMTGPRGAILMVRAFADARPCVRRNVFIAGTKQAICGDMTGESAIRSASLDTSRIKGANEVIATDRFWGKL